MTARLPNTEHWQRIRRVFGALDGRRWRSAAAAALGMPVRGLRVAIDRELDAADMHGIDLALRAAVDAAVERSERRLERMRNVARDVATMNNRRSHAYAETPVDLSGLDGKFELFPWEESLREILEAA